MNRNEKGLIAGLDEVGMGCLAGPLVICVAAFKHHSQPIAGVRDSKALTKRQRELLITPIVEQAYFIGLGFASVERINKMGIAESWQWAASMAMEDGPHFDLLIVDGDREAKCYSGVQDVRPKADATCWQVSAASVVAKVIRDSHMKALAAYYPHYDWEHNAGYGAPKHIAGLKKEGPTPFHRRQFIRKIIGRKYAEKQAGFPI